MVVTHTIIFSILNNKQFNPSNPLKSALANFNALNHSKIFTEKRCVRVCFDCFCFSVENKFFGTNFIFTFCFAFFKFILFCSLANELNQWNGCSTHDNIFHVIMYFVNRFLHLAGTNTHAHRHRHRHIGISCHVIEKERKRRIASNTHMRTVSPSCMQFKHTQIDGELENC